MAKNNIDTLLHIFSQVGENRDDFISAMESLGHSQRTGRDEYYRVLQHLVGKTNSSSNGSSRPPEPETNIPNPPPNPPEPEPEPEQTSKKKTKPYQHSGWDAWRLYGGDKERRNAYNEYLKKGIKDAAASRGFQGDPEELDKKAFKKHFKGLGGFSNEAKALRDLLKHADYNYPNSGYSTPAGTEHAVYHLLRSGVTKYYEPYTKTEKVLKRARKKGVSAHDLSRLKSMLELRDEYTSAATGKLTPEQYKQDEVFNAAYLRGIGVFARRLVREAGLGMDLSLVGESAQSIREGARYTQERLADPSKIPVITDPPEPEPEPTPAPEPEPEREPPTPYEYSSWRDPLLFGKDPASTEGLRGGIQAGIEATASSRGFEGDFSGFTKKDFKKLYKGFGKYSDEAGAVRAMIKHMRPEGMLVSKMSRVASGFITSGLSKYYDPYSSKKKILRRAKKKGVNERGLQRLAALTNMRDRIVQSYVDQLPKELQSDPSYYYKARDLGVTAYTRRLANLVLKDKVSLGDDDRDRSAETDSAQTNTPEGAGANTGTTGTNKRPGEDGGIDWESFNEQKEEEERRRKKEQEERDAEKRQKYENMLLDEEYRRQIEDEAEPYWKGKTTQNRPSPSADVPEALTNVPFAFTGKGDPKDIKKYPVYGEKFASTRAHERSRIESQPFIEWALKQYPMASDSFILRLGKDMGFALSGHWIADVRKVMNVPRPDFKTTEAADTFYEVHALHQKATSRRGDLGQRTESDVVSGFTRANPFSQFNKERRQAEKEFRTAESRRVQLANDVHVARNAGVGAEGIERLDARLREYVASDEYQRAKKDASAYQSGRSVDYSTGRRTKSGAAVARDFTDEDEAAFQKREEILDDIKGSWNPHRKEVNRGHVFTKETQGAMRAKDKEDYIYRTSAGAGGLSVKGVLKRLTKIGATLLAIYAVGKKVYSAIKDSLQKTWELAPYNARLGAVKAQYEGKEFKRTVEFAAGTEAKRVELAREWDELLESTMELRIAFANFALWLQKWVVRTTRGVHRFYTRSPMGMYGTGLGLAGVFLRLWGGTQKKQKKRNKREERKERKEREKREKRIENYESERKKNLDEVEATATLAREYYETGKINKTAQAASPYADKSATELMALLHNKDMRASFEDAIAFSDLRRGEDYFQGYSDVEKGSATTLEDLKRILQVLDNTNVLATHQLDVLLATERAAQETAVNTRANKTDKEVLLNHPVFVAMQKMAQTFAPTGNETAYTSNERNQWGAEPKKLYGRFAGLTNIGHKGEDAL